MKINKLVIPEAKTNALKLKPIKFNGKPPGNLVALIGRNGAGKSRILHLIEKFHETIDGVNYFEDLITGIPQNLIDKNKSNIEIARRNYLNYIKLGESHAKDRLKVELHRRMSTFINDFLNCAPAYVKVVKHSDLISVQNYMKDPKFNFEQLLSNQHLEDVVAKDYVMPITANSDLLNEFDKLNNKNTFEYFNKLTTQIVVDEFNTFINSKDDLLKFEEKIKSNQSHLLFEKFSKHVENFLGKEITYKYFTNGNIIESVIYFDGIPFDIEKLSPGQRTLLAYAILFYFLDINANNNLSESIIIVDEPELNLHPEAQIKLIDSLRKVISEKGQIWIATHSLHILAHINYNEIFMVKDGELFSPQSSLPSKIIKDLVIYDEHVYELGDVLDSIAGWAFVNFMKQCFQDPETINVSNPKDPQFILFKNYLSNENITLLDFGAGGGRFIKTISELDTLKNKIQYYAFEINENSINELNSISEIKSVFDKLEKIPDNSFDCVTMCNVLHEIPIDEWIVSLNKIKSCLKDNGFLIFIEDRFLPKGEKIQPHGYLILDTKSIRILMNHKKSIEIKHEDLNYKDRIVFNVFFKSEINPTNKTLIKAIECLKNESFENIKEMRASNSTDVAHGRKYANETQLYVNSCLALEQFQMD